MIDNVMVNIGVAFMIVGGAVLVSVVLDVAIYAAALILVSAINKLRRRAKLVTRCKECKHYGMGVCLKIYSDGNVHSAAWQSRNPEDYCSYGERKDGGDNDAKSV